METEVPEPELATPKKTGHGRRCAAYGCGNTKNVSNFSVFQFPFKRPLILRKWAQFVHSKRKGWEGPTTANGLCAAHFTDDCFPLQYKLQKALGINPGPLRPNEDAVPTIHTQLASPEPTTSANHYPRPATATPLRGAYQKRLHAQVLEEALTSHAAAVAAAAVAATANAQTEPMDMTNDAEDSSQTALTTTKPTVRNVGTQKRYRPKQCSKAVQARPIKFASKAVNTEKKRTRDIGTMTCDLPITPVTPAMAPTTPPPVYDDVECSSPRPDSECEDSTYNPDGTAEMSDTVDETDDESVVAGDGERKFIVGERQLRELFSKCRECLNQPIVDIRTSDSGMGAKILVDQSCGRCGTNWTWCNTSAVGTTHTASLNLEVSSAILYSGMCPTKALRMMQFMGVQCISIRTFFDHQRFYLQPSIMEVWNDQRASYISEVLDSKRPLILGGDGRCDTPGHSAKFGAYSLMDLERGRVMSMNIVQSNEVDNSNAMEKEGLIRALTELHTEGLVVGTLVTDRHPQIRCWVRQQLTENKLKWNWFTKHQFDVWHVAKSLMKRLLALGKEKECEAILAWLKSFINHMYWVAASTPDAQGDIMWAKWQSLLNHVMNVHEGHSPLFPYCLHGPIDPARPKLWLKPGTKVYERLQSIITTSQIKKDIPMLSPGMQTSSLEAYHSVVNHFAPKMIGFSYHGMVSRVTLAALHFNENTQRKQVVDSEGKPKYTITFPKEKKGDYTLEAVKGPRTYKYVDDLKAVTMRHALTPMPHVVDELPEPPPALSASFVRPDLAQAIERLTSRYSIPSVAAATEDQRLSRLDLHLQYGNNQEETLMDAT